jgi:hypothetical protein
MISLDKKFIFMHIPKTGGTSVESSALSNHAYYLESELASEEPNTFIQKYWSKEFLDNRQANYNNGELIKKGALIGKHFNLYEYYLAFTNENDIAKYFAEQDAGDTSRNPLDDFYRFTVARNPWDRLVSYFFTVAEEYNEEYFKDFVSKGQCVSTDFERPSYFRQDRGLTFNTHSVTSWLGGENSLFDYVMRFENINEDFKNVCEDLGIEHEELPHVNKTTEKSNHYSHYYNDETREMVAENYADDIENFGYSYEAV